MSFFKLITNNVFRSARTYGSYFLSSVFSVFVFFIFAMLTFHPQLQSGITGSSAEVTLLARMGLGVSQVLVVLLSFIFLWYSFWTFLKARKRDLGIYMMLGIKPKDLRKMLFGENMLIGLSASIVGIGLGVLFTKVILIVVQNVLALGTGLKFYFPVVGSGLTLVTYIVLFLLVSLIMTFKIQTENLNQLGKSDETPMPLPKTHPLLVLGAFLSLAAGYGSLVYFLKKEASLWLLLSCVLLTVLATFLFFHQVTVYYYRWRRNRRTFWRGKTMLAVSEGIYRAKENATMYALIACTASVALVAISTTASLGSAQTGNRNGISAAIVLVNDQEENSSDYPLTVGKQINQAIEKAGHDSFYFIGETYPVQYFPKGETGDFFAYAMKASDYNQLAKGVGAKELHPKPGEIYELAGSISQLNEFKQMTPSERVEKREVLTTSGKQTMTLKRLPLQFRIAQSYRFYIAPDEEVARFAIPEGYEMAPTRYQVIDYDQWQSDKDLGVQIQRILSQDRERFDKKFQAIYDKSDQGKDTEADYKELYRDYYSYESRYEVWQNQRQANGLVLMIGLLLGGVFFIFTASIFYFRLFGDLDKEGRYHRSLYQIGLPPKSRHRLVSGQMLQMFFIPLLVAILHSAVAYWGIVELAEINLWSHFFTIIGCYLLAMSLLYLVCRFFYLRNLDERAESPGSF
ncbi:ABC transporter permease [Enterococcus asini]|uniref:ABC transporter permease n=1 Tax=Enterococcus asini TaxID=57732 RepID=UPI00288E0838|nr:ABC transporter permease [Enterococcus asini]MDT2744520.1 ABC transporter permease [Enterococcus asini]